MKPTRVLVIEDDLPTQRHLRKALQQQGLEIFCESSLIGARRFLRSNDVDLLLLDLFLPDGCGYELLTGTNDVVQGRPIVAMTSVFVGSANTALLKRLFGFRSILPKPIDSVEPLLEAFNGALGTSLVYRSPDEASAKLPPPQLQTPLREEPPTPTATPTPLHQAPPAPPSSTPSEPVQPLPTPPSEPVEEVREEPPSLATSRDALSSSSSSSRSPRTLPRSTSQNPTRSFSRTPSSNPRPTARRTLSTPRTIQRPTASSSRLPAISSSSLSTSTPSPTSSSTNLPSRSASRSLRSERRIIRPTGHDTTKGLSTRTAPAPTSTSSHALKTHPRDTDNAQRAFGFDLTDPPQQGRLDQHTLPWLLARLAAQRATGSLLLRQEKTKKIVYLRDGAPVAVKSNLLPECLGRLLVRAGTISQEDCDMSFERLKAEQRLQGQVLLEMGALDEETLQNALQDQFITKIKDIISWDRGLFQFRPSDEIPTQPYMSARLPEDVIVAGMRGAFSSERALRDLHAEFERFPMLIEGALLWDEVSWSESERSVLKRFDGAHTLYEVVTDAENAESAQRLTYALVCLDAVAFRSERFA